MISPTRKGVRHDAAGDGNFNAGRGGTRRHDGMDFLCDPGQDLYMPIQEGYLLRRRYPYADDITWQGIHIVGRDRGAQIELVIFYCMCEPSTQRRYIGERIGYCQNITKRYPDQGMLAHVHLQIERVDPVRFFTEGELWDWSDLDPAEIAKG